jgi:hypothetical protein
VQELVSEGLITRDEARTHARRNIVTRALGIEPTIGVDTWTLPLIAGDRYLLCSDGLVDEVSDIDIETCLKLNSDPQQTANQLVEMANKNGGRDNTTVIVVDVLDKDTKTVSKPVNSTLSKPEINLSIRKLIISVVVAAVAIVASVIAFSYARSGYFVAYEDQTPAARVLIYQGKEFLWFNPTIEADSTLIRSDLNFAQDTEIIAKPNFSSPTDAQKYVNQIREVVDGN